MSVNENELVSNQNTKEIASDVKRETANNCPDTTRISEDKEVKKEHPEVNYLKSGAEEKGLKRSHPSGEKEVEEEQLISKRSKLAKKLEADDLPMKVPFKVIDGVRHLAPYWTVYRCRTKGRWIGRKLVEVFTKEFLSLNEHYVTVACMLGRIYVNGQQMTDLNYKLKNADYIEHWGHRHEHPVLDTTIRVVANTDDLLVIDKPPSLPVHACGQYCIHTVLGLLRTEHGLTGLRVLHRLDRTTSGILMFAKNYETDLEFKQTLKKGEWTKEYVCKVDGVFPEGEVSCNQPLGNLVVSMGIQCVRSDGKEARTRFTRLWTDGQTSVVRAVIDTGRTHQIRVHAQYLGFPIVGDQIYNKDVWGPNKGKNAEYGKSFEELISDVQNGHRSSNWHEIVDGEYETMMQTMANGELTPEPTGLSREQRPEKDPICLGCNIVKKKVPDGHFMLYLHCLKYQTANWCYSTPLPAWAIQPAPCAIPLKL